MKKKLPSQDAVASASVMFLCACTICLIVILQATNVYSQAVMIKDVNQQDELEYNEYRALVTSRSFFYFVSNNELWRNNGTPESSVKLRTFKRISNLKMSGSTLFFAADDGSGEELWKSTGSTASTVRVKDIYPGASSSAPKNLTDVNGTLYFTAVSPGFGREVWKSNGTGAGTVLVKDVFPKAGSSNPSWLCNVNGVLFFAANDGTRGYELWKTIGTAEGTEFVKDIRPGDRISSSPEQFTAAGTTLYFVANDGITGKELWKSDGTAAGTLRVKDIFAGSQSAGIQNITAVNATVFFTANDGKYGHELWKSNGTTAGTLMVKDMTPGPAGSHGETTFSHQMGSFKNINGTLFFTAYMGPDYYIWKSDGTASGTVTLSPAGGPGMFQPNAQFTFVNNKILFFNDVNSSEYYYLYSMNPDGSNIQGIQEFVLIDFYSPYYPVITAFNNRLYIAARGEYNEGFKIYKSDGTWEGSGELTDVYTPTLGSSPKSMVSFKGKVYFQTSWDEIAYPYTEFILPEVWRTDGTEAGTEFLFNANYIETAVSGDKLFIAGTSWDDSNDHLWMVDAAGVLTDLKIFPAETGVDKLINVNGIVYITTIDAEVWRSNGTAAGTFRVKAGGDGFIRTINSIGSTVIFHHSSREKEELWKSNGTVASTVRIATIRNTPGVLTRFTPSVVYNGIMYFVANDGVHGNEIWRTNGTATGTFMAFDINGNDNMASGQDEVDIASLHVFQNELYMSVRQIILSTSGEVQSDKWELRHWNQNMGQSTAIAAEIDAATSMMPDANVLYLKTVSSSNMASLVAFTPAAGIQKLQDFGNVFSIGAGPDFAFVNGEMYFSMWSGALWRTSGTPCSTVPISTGSPYVNYEFEVVGSNMILGAATNQFGNEPHILSLSSIPPPPVCNEISASTSTENTEAAIESVAISSHPNPFSDYFKLRVNTKANESLRLMVFRMDGTPVEEISSLQTATDYEIGRNWLPGWHIIHAVTSSGIYTTKVIKQ